MGRIQKSIKKVIFDSSILPFEEFLGLATKAQKSSKQTMPTF
jgi:hypothetical protein